MNIPFLEAPREVTFDWHIVQAKKWLEFDGGRELDSILVHAAVELRAAIERYIQPLAVLPGAKCADLFQNSLAGVPPRRWCRKSIAELHLRRHRRYLRARFGVSGSFIKQYKGAIRPYKNGQVHATQAGSVRWDAGRCRWTWADARGAT